MQSMRIEAHCDELRRNGACRHKGEHTLR
jgi:hypothetical protein